MNNLFTVPKLLAPRLSPLWLASNIDFAWVSLLTLICIVTRLIAVPASLWEWDDILFARALHQYDLAAHIPHPPGFPVFVLLNRAAYAVLHDEHQALVTVAFIFSAFLTPALFYFYREIFKDRQIAVAGALIGSFVPSVWVFSCAGRSDGPAFALGIIAATLILRGLTSHRSLWLGCAVLGLGMGVRVTLLPWVAPLLLTVLLLLLRRRAWQATIWAIAILALCILSWYLPLIWHQTWQAYSDVVSKHRQYIWETDSIFAANRNNIISYRIARYFGDIWGAEWIAHTVYTLSALGLLAFMLRRRWQLLGWLLVIFVPYLIFAFVLTTPLGSAFYALPYIPLFTGLAAGGLVLLPRLLVNAKRQSHLSNIGLPIAIIITIGFAGWSYPIIKMFHEQESPTLSAVHYLQKNLDSQRDLLVYDGVFRPHVQHYLSGFRTISRAGAMKPEAGLSVSATGRPSLIYLTEAPVVAPGTQHFAWRVGKGAQRLGRLSLARYSDVYIYANRTSSACGVIFLSGWDEQKTTESGESRWLRTKGEIALLGTTETIKLRLQGALDARLTASLQPKVILHLDGREIDRVKLEGEAFDREITVTPNSRSLWPVLTVEIDSTAAFMPASSNREPGLSCTLLNCTLISPN